MRERGLKLKSEGKDGNAYVAPVRERGLKSVGDTDGNKYSLSLP